MKRPIPLVLALLALAGPARAQLGAMGVSPEAFERLPTFEPPEGAVGVNYRMDLRRYLPPVGDQNPQQSCVGWAIAYAAKTYYEVHDQGWEPDAYDRIFSPAFIYNQINMGRDRGSIVTHALDLLVRQGCATLAKMPYNPGNFVDQPSDEARRQALNFRIDSYAAVRNRAQIIAALTDRHVVIVVVRTNPVFNSGRYDLYTAQLMRQGDEELRRQNSPGGLHAMTAVGFDDTRQALLLMNSWSSAWGQDGYCWVSYDLVENVQPRSGAFLQEAYIIRDIPLKLDRQAGVELSLQAQQWYTGFENGQHTFGWKGRLATDAQTLAGIDRVVWELRVDPVQKYENRSAATAFEFIGWYRGQGRLPVVAEVHGHDGAVRRLPLEVNFQAPEARQRPLELAQTDRYWGLVTMDNGAQQPYWEWTVRIAGDLVDLADIQQVTYHLHPTFNPPDRVVADGPANGFAYTTRGWGVFDVGATILFKDGSTSTHKLRLAFRDPRRDQLSLRNSSRYVRTDENGARWWDWTAFLDGPAGVLRQIDRVEYHLHPTFNPALRVAADDPERGFPMSTTGWGTFNLRANVIHRDGQSQWLEHRLHFEQPAGGDEAEKPPGKPAH